MLLLLRALAILSRLVLFLAFHLHLTGYGLSIGAFCLLFLLRSRLYQVAPSLWMLLHLTVVIIHIVQVSAALLTLLWLSHALVTAGFAKAALGMRAMTEFSHLPPHLVTESLKSL